MTNNAIGCTIYKIACVTKDGKWQWKRDTGEPVSPEFSTSECAESYAGRMPFMTDDEWRMHGALPPKINFT